MISYVQAAKSKWANALVKLQIDVGVIQNCYIILSISINCAYSIIVWNSLIILNFSFLRLLSPDARLIEGGEGLF